MYLKKIVLCGFKSFADRVTLNFDKEHITGVVGPNGSGKSNVIDAVRWVMGEQNTKLLRGEKATDIIFSGSEKRKALGMAEVSLSFDNSESSPHCPPEYRFDEEIVLTRRLYSDGQREYLINRKPCRLKDIVGFFIASGLGSRSYSMIQQGQVDRILQAKPEELREIIEEAAGTQVFKKRRLETEKKLEATRVNLSRLDDILKEIVERKESLREQAKKAEKWKELAATLKKKEFELLSQSFLNHKEKMVQIDRQLEKSKALESELLSELAAYELDYKRLQIQLETADPEVAVITENLAQVREKMASLEVRLVNAIELLETGEDRLKLFEKQIDEENKNVSTFEKQCKESDKEYHKSKKESEQASKALEKYEKQLLDIEEMFSHKEDLIQDFQEEIRGVDKLLDANKARLQHILEQTNSYRRQKEDYTKKLIVLENEHSQALILTDSAHVKVKTQQKEINSLLEQKRAQKSLLEKKEKNHGDTKNRLEIAKNSYIELSAHLSHIEDAKKKQKNLHSSFSELKNKVQLKKLCFLAENLSFNGKKISKLLAKAFDGWSNRLIVDDIKNIVVIEKVLHQLKIGKTSVSIAVENNSEQKEYDRWADKHELESILSYVNIKSEYKKSCEAILSRVFVHQEKSKGIEQVLPDLMPGAILISEDGTVYTNKRELTIGVDSGDGLLFLQKRESEIRQKIKTVSEKINKQKQEENSLLGEIKKINLNLEESNQQYLDANKKLLYLIGDFQTQEQKANYKQEMIVSLRQEYTELVEKNKAVETEINDLKKNNEVYREEKMRFNLQYQDVKEELKAYLDNKDELKIKIGDIRLQKMSAETRYQTLKSGYEQLQNQLVLLKKQYSHKNKEHDQLNQNIQEAKSDKKKFQDALKEMISEKKSFETRLEKKKSENSELAKELKKIEDKLKKVSQKRSIVQSSVNDKNIEKEKIKVFLTSVVNQCQDQQSVDLDKEKIEKDKNFNAKNTTRQIQSLKERIEKIGSINMVAIDEFKEYEKRHLFIEEQRKEITSSIDLLELAIDEISETSKEKFMLTFQILNKEFQELFPILFPKGEGKIVLESPENPLDTNVEIVVRLPGKSHQSMRLFSGGEKALTAIALIFALLKSKPTPFCFLDEVDAALDEANVGRYNKVLETLSDRFQFIVITHRRKTMEVLDTLYGVTMQEPGVSKLVGVDLAKDLPNHLQKSFKELPNKQLKPATPGGYVL